MDLNEQFNIYLEKNNFSSYNPKELYEPLDYILSLGGKRIRPLLTLMSCQIFSEDISAAFPAAYAIEIFHNFSLLHDDIMDKSALRRGQATVHEKYNTNTAILSGDVMLVYAYKYLNKVPSKVLAPVLSTFNSVAISVCEGQQMDMNFETTAKVSIDEYKRMIELKTSILLYGAMKIGALIGGATESESELVAEFGKNMGIAFQMQDDFLDTYGKKAKLGKRIGGDILQNKKTYLVIKALELADAETKTKLENWLSTSSPVSQQATKIKNVTAIFNKLGIPNEMETIIKLYYNNAINCLNQLKKPDQKKVQLLDLLKSLMDREY